MTGLGPAIHVVLTLSGSPGLSLPLAPKDTI